MHMDKTSSVESKNMGDYGESGGRVGLLSMPSHHPPWFAVEGCTHLLANKEGEWVPFQGEALL